MYSSSKTAVRGAHHGRVLVGWQTGARRALPWHEQEARLVIFPIDAALKARLRSEERTRLAYPFHFYYNVLMRKRINNLVQQGRLTARSVGLREFPDDDIVMGADLGAVASGDAAPAKAKASKDAAASASAAAAAGGAESVRTSQPARASRAVARWGLVRSRVAKQRHPTASLSAISSRLQSSSIRTPQNVDELSAARRAEQLEDHLDLVCVD